MANTCVRVPSVLLRDVNKPPFSNSNQTELPKVELESNRTSKSQTRVEPSFKDRTSYRTELLENFELTK